MKLPNRQSSFTPAAGIFAAAAKYKYIQINKYQSAQKQKCTRSFWSGEDLA